MSLLDKLERRLGRFAVPHLTLAIVALQAPVYVLNLVQQRPLEPILLIPARVLAGEAWRLFTFVAVPPQMHPLFAFFYFYLFYLMGTTLEARWGHFRYNVFLLIGYVATVAVAFLTPEVPAGNTFIQMSVWLAFAYLYPDFELLLFFLLPVKIKYLAMLTWALYGWMAVTGPWHTRLAIAASVLNFFLFFGRDIWLRMRSSARRMHARREELVRRHQPRHQCRVCGKTDQSHPQMIFRYCSKCAGNPCYCEEHIYDHEHIEEVSV